MKPAGPALLLTAVLLLTACGGRNRQPAAAGDTLAFRHATLLRVSQRAGYALAEVADPWHEGRTLRRYVLVPRGSALPPHLPEGTLVRTPVKRAAVLSTVHAGLLFELGCGGAVAAICDLRYSLLPALHSAVAGGRTADAGSSMKPDAERIVAAGAEALLVSPFENAGYGTLERLGVPLIECADYMERSALGRAEWMRFYGLLFGCPERADSLFATVEAGYGALSRLTQGVRRRPRLLVDRKEGAVWFVPAGRSAPAGLYADAGADYLFARTPGSGSAQLSFETVFAQGREADVWLIKYGSPANLTYASLAGEQAAYRSLRPWKERHVYACNTLQAPFYEETPFHPDRLLADFIKIFHPRLLPGHRLRYYHPLED